MCGIVGVLSSDLVNRDLFRSMCEVLAHRGPDGGKQEYLNNGRIALGHRRLSIIDLSDAGIQPMSNEDGTVWITFNGEIYNFSALRTELEQHGHRFSSNSDTEVILHAYEEWGEKCVGRLRGIFAFGLWDNTRRKLFLARDHLGVKPLYYYYLDGHLIFASEIKSILADPSVSRILCKSAVSDYLTYGYVPYDKSIFENIWKVPAGYYLTYSNGILNVEKYWDLVYREEITDEYDAIESVRSILEDSIGVQLVSDVPVGVLLSGGIDSSAVNVLASRVYPGVMQAFTMGFDDSSHDEVEYARRVAQISKSLHREQQMTYLLAKESLGLFARIYDEPFFDSSGIPTYYISQLTSKHVKVALSGDGGDEVFAGYLRYDWLSKSVSAEKPDGLELLTASILQPMVSRFSKRHWRLERLKKQFLATLTDPFDFYFNKLCFLDRHAQRLLLSSDMQAHMPDDETWLFRQYWHDDYPRISAAQYLDIKTYLVDDILVKVDRASMANGLEVRVPLLDIDLIERVFRISSKLLYKKQERKYLLKQALQESLPVDILSSRKQGFSVPMISWFGMGLRDLAKRMLCDGSLVNRTVFNREHLMNFVNIEHPEMVWLILSLELWARRWLENEPIESGYFDVQ